MAPTCSTPRSAFHCNTRQHRGCASAISGCAAAYIGSEPSVCRTHYDSSSSGVTIALSVLALLSRDEAVAKDPQLFELIPCLARLLRAPSLAQACGRDDLPNYQNASPAEVHKDALEILWNMCGHAEEAATIALQSNAVSSLGKWLRLNFSIQPASSSQCAISLMFAILQPCLSLVQQGYGAATSAVTKGPDPAEFLQEMYAATEGIAHVCALDCSVRPTTCDTSCTTDHLGCVELGNEARVNPTPQEAQAVQLQGFSALAAIMSCLSSVTNSQLPRVSAEEPSWAEDLRVAVHRALRSRLPLLHLLHVFSVLDSLIELQGPNVLLFSANNDGQLHHSTTRLLILVVQVLKVQVYSHLQGCVLHVQASGTSSILSESLQLSDAVFTTASRLISKILDLVVAMDQTEGRSDTESAVDFPVHGRDVTAAKSEGILVEVCMLDAVVSLFIQSGAQQLCMQQGFWLIVRFLQILKALKESASSMLDFIAFITGDNSGDEPEPVQIPKGFRMEADVSASKDHGGHSKVQRGTSPEFGSSRVFKADKLQELSGEVDRGWAMRTLQACSVSVGMLLSLTGGVETSTQLLAALPGLCSWVCHRINTGKAVALKEQVAPVQSLISALHVMQVLNMSGGALTDACKTVLQKPEVFMVVCLCGITSMKQWQEYIQSASIFWHESLSSKVVVTCELISAAFRNLSDDSRLSAGQLYMQVHKCSVKNSSEALLPCLVATSNELQCALVFAMPDITSALREAADGTDVAAVVDAVGAVADLTTAAMSDLSEFKGSDIFQPLCNAFGALRLLVEFVIMSRTGEHAHLIQSLVRAGEQELTCWQTAPDNALLAFVEKGSDVCPIVERCCSICASITFTLEMMPPLSTTVRKATWIGQYLEEETDLLLLLKTLEEDGSSVSLGHALNSIAIVLRS